MANRSIRDGRLGLMERPLGQVPMSGAPNDIQGPLLGPAFQPPAQPLPRPAPVLGAGPPAVARRPGELPKPAPRPAMPPAPMQGATGPGMVNPGMVRVDPLPMGARRE